LPTEFCEAALLNIFCIQLIILFLCNHACYDSVSIWDMLHSSFCKLLNISHSYTLLGAIISLFNNQCFLLVEYDEIESLGTACLRWAYCSSFWSYMYGLLAQL
jgi:hypothetical protein